MSIREQVRLTRRGLLCALLVSAALRRPAHGMPNGAASAVDADLILCVTGILQPTSSTQVYCFLRHVFDGEESAAVAADVRAAIRWHVLCGHLLEVWDAPEPLYSVTLKGNANLGHCWRRLRDQTRMFLLRGRLGCKSPRPREDVPVALTGASPVSLIRTSIQRHSALSDSLGHISEEGFAGIRPGLLGASRGQCLPFLSFESLEQLAKAGALVDGSRRISPIGMSLALGVSSHFLEWLASCSDKQYRHFKIKNKKSKRKKRKIESPRVFLKTTQRFLLSCILGDLHVHGSVHSFRSGRSCISNAMPHEGQEFVARTDIVDFFGSLSSAHIRALLSKHHFPGPTIDLIAGLCTFEGRLPQGAPTSPLLSNAALFDFDAKLTERCRKAGLNYTRYADDITISGNNRVEVHAALQAAQVNLSERFGLCVNKAKTRVIHRSAQQRVTGLVVNHRALPPRAERRRIRAMFDRAGRDPANSLGMLASLRGYRSYLGAFSQLTGSDEIERYDLVLARLEALRGGGPQ